MEKKQQEPLTNNKNADNEVSGHTNTGESSNLTSDPAPKPNIAVTRTSQVMAVLSSLRADKEAWPQAFYEAVLERWARMPRGGWQMATDVYCSKFHVKITQGKFKALAQQVLISENRKRCSLKDYSQYAAKKRRTDVCPNEAKNPRPPGTSNLTHQTYRRTILRGKTFQLKGP